MKTLRRTSTAPLLAAALLGAAIALAAAAQTAEGQAKKKPPATPTVRIQAKAFTKRVAPIAENSITIPYGQRLSITCNNNERAIGQGLISSTHYLTAQSFGPAAGSSFVVGPPGTAKVRKQLLCAKNVTVRNIRKPARHIPAGGVNGMGRATGAVTCPVGFAPSGMQSVLDYAPGFGAFSSIPNGPRGWKVEAFMVPDAIKKTAWAEAAFIDIACVKAVSVTKLTRKIAIGANGVATTNATCPGTRRALGWGMKLDAYTQRLFSANGRWATPYVSRAQFTPNGRAMNFQFRLPSGVDLTTSTGSKIEVHVVCGLPRK